MEWDATGATVSDWPPTIATGAVTPLQFVLVFHGASGTPALRLWSMFSASRVPPPPIECPATARRFASARERTALGDEPVAHRSAAMSSWPRWLGWSNSEFVSMPTTTKPQDDTRGPSQERLDQVAVKPGETAITGYVPAVVG